LLQDVGALIKREERMRGMNKRAAAVAAALIASSSAAGSAFAQKATECSASGVCYCVLSELKPVIDAKLASVRALIDEQRKAGKTIGFMSVPLSTGGGGYFAVNAEVAAATKAAIEKRLGADKAFVLNPADAGVDLPNGGGADYMYFWTQMLEGKAGMGEDFDFVHFVGPVDFARFFKFTGEGDMAKVEAYYDERVKTDPGLVKAAERGVNKTTFRNYYALRASVAWSRGAHDEWNIFTRINERRRADPKYGVLEQMPMLFQGGPIPTPAMESPVSPGYVGKCAS
jgi:hypothetical protein